MLQSKVQDLERDLLGSLLDQEDQREKSEKSLKISSNITRPQALSAPPTVFIQYDFKINYDILNQYNFDSPDPEDRSITMAFSNKGLTQQNYFHSLQIPQQNFRKMSYDSGPISCYSNSDNNILEYYRYSSMVVLTPQQQLLNNLSQVIDWSKDQNGSRAVQAIFQSNNQQNKGKVFNIIINDAKSLIKDRFGNYVFQKIFQKGSLQNKEILLNELWGQMLELSMHAYGCRVIQKALDFIVDKKQRQKQFIDEILTSSLYLMQNQNGNHVIQKCLQTFPHQLVQPLADIIIQRLYELPFDSFGCRVVQKYFQYHRGQQKCELALKKLLNQTVQLSQCQFGNYVMQHIVTKCQQERKIVFQIFINNIVDLSINKYASNVVQKAIQSSGSKFCQLLSQYFLANQKDLIMLSKHQYGNYVIQSMYEKAGKDKKMSLKQILKSNTGEISKSQYGRHVLMQLDKIRPNMK